MEDSITNWLCIEKKNIDENLYKNTGKNYSRILIQLLANRNINTEDKINSFLNPSLKLLHPPELMPNIARALERILKAIEKNESILIFGDYDTDGIISSVLMHNFLSRIGLNPEIYIPDRFKEGYDITPGFIKGLSKNKKYNLVICVDCGTNSTEVKKFVLSEKCKIDVIACDHHEPGKELEREGEHEQDDRYIIVNPKLKYSKYPFKYLSGAGVTFKLIIGLLRSLDEKIKKKFEKDYLSKLLDLVAISVISDVMPLTDENRIFVKNGLKIMNNTKNNGLKRMIEVVLGGKNGISVYDIGFIIAPRLNAAGRVKNAVDSVNLLKDGSADFEKIINDLEKFNRNRQEVQKNIVKEILESNEINLIDIVKNNKIFIGKSKDWNEGVLGVAASDIVKKINVPVILFKEFENNELKGSGRSVENFDLYSNLCKLSSYFIKFGGHKQACGITMTADNFEKFQEELSIIASKAISDEEITKKQRYDLETDFKEINTSLVRELETMEPFGTGNQKPLFLTNNCLIEKIDFNRSSRGKMYANIKLRNNDIILDALFFNLSGKFENEKSNKLTRGANVNILFNIEGKKQINGNMALKLIIQDLKLNLKI